MFERFSEGARRVVVLAQDEATRLRHDRIGTEHILLGLVRDVEGSAARALASLEISLDAVRSQIAATAGVGTTDPADHIPFSPHAKNAFDLASQESSDLGHHLIRSGHILLALIREDECMAAQVLKTMSPSPDAVRRAALTSLAVKPALGHGTSGPAVLSRSVGGGMLLAPGFVPGGQVPYAGPLHALVPPIPLYLRVAGGVLVVFGVFNLAGLAFLPRDQWGSAPSIALNVLAIVALVGAGVGLLLRRRWAWPLAMFLGLVALVLGVVSFFQGQADAALLVFVVPGATLLASLLSPASLRWFRATPI